jgi:hypothetical protein
MIVSPIYRGTMIFSFNNKFMFIFLLTVDNNRNNKRVDQTGSRLCTIRVVWCDRPYDPMQLNWTKLEKCSESIKLIKTSRVEMSRIVRVITPNDATRPNSLVESDRLVWSRLWCDSTKQFCWDESDRLVWSRLQKKHFITKHNACKWNIKE